MRIRFTIAESTHANYVTLTHAHIIPVLGLQWQDYDPILRTLTVQRLVKNLGIGITLHGLRHSHATALIAAGVPINAVSESLGHSETSTTMNIYVHCSPAMQQRATDETRGVVAERVVSRC